jgi:type II secretory pathway pseudopilin PulG
MNMKVRSSEFGVRIDWKRGSQSRPAIRIPQSAFRNWMAFTLVEILVTMILLSFIVLALMTVFNSTQNAFRASLTQTDVRESGRLATDLIKGDLEAMTPSLAQSNAIVFNSTNNNVNFYAAVTTFTSPPSPLYQSLIGVSDPSTMRTNVLESFFSLSRQNVSGSPSWVGTGYVVNTNSPDGALYPLYRFYMSTNTITGTPASLYNAFYNAFITNSLTSSPPWSHLMDGVVDLTVRAYDPNGLWMTNTYPFYNGSASTTNNNVYFLPFLPLGSGSGFGETGSYMFSNTVPASVDVELGVLEDAVLQRAEGLSGTAQLNYLSNHVGQVHLFRQRIWIRNVDPTAYQ